MDVRHCTECGQVFRFIGRRLCPACVEKDEADFASVRAYLQEHPGATLFQTEQAVGVGAARILKWLKEGRLETTQGAVPGLECERCGQSVPSGRFCAPCQAALSRGFKVEPARDTARASTAGSAIKDEHGGRRGHDWANRRNRG